MKAPNKQSCTLSWSRERALADVGRVLKKIIPKLREADREDAPIFMSLDKTEEEWVNTFFSTHESVSKKFQDFLNEALQKEVIPYRLTIGLCDVNTRLYAFRVKHT